jgi:eukaryotic-like serine/threonine-protein kinase
MEGREDVAVSSAKFRFRAIARETDPLKSAMISRTSAEKYAEAKEIFLTASELDAAERAEFVRRRCGGDAEMLTEVESLLAVGDKAEKFLELPAVVAVSRHEQLKNKTIGCYRLVSEIGAGGMGVVFLAEQSDAGFCRHVALKIVKNSLYSESLFKRFNLERQILASLEHPNIARLIDGGTTDDNLPYLVMEYVEGVPLIEYAESKNLSLDERLELFRQVCEAVAYSHKNAVIHRDLKPSNILVTEDGTAKLLDFGISKLLSSDNLLQMPPPRQTSTTFRALTPEYASPEQIRGEAVTTVSDVYSLGVILYELLTGKSPYKINPGNLNEIVRAVCEIEPVRPSLVPSSNSKLRSRKTLRGDLDNIILKALRKEPAHRYHSVEALNEDLQRHLKGLPVSARRDTFAYRAGKFVRRNRAATLFAAFGVLALVGGVIAAVWQAHRAEQERARAERRFNDVRALANSFMFELNDEILKGQT